MGYLEDQAAYNTLARYGLTKIAESAWQRALRLGQIGSKELSQIAGGAPVPASGRGWIQGIRKSLTSFASDLHGSALDRHRQLQDKLTPALMAHHGTTPQNLRWIGPATAGGDTYVSPQTGTMLRELAEGSMPRRLAATATMASGKDLPEALYRRLKRPEDASITNAVLKHELGEQRMALSTARSKYAPNPFASHFGPAADMAERLGTRDPRAMEVMDRLRASTGKDDPRARKIFREHGMLGSYTPPLGGKTHRSIEGAIERMPVDEGAMNRALSGAPFTGDSRKWFERTQQAGQALQHVPHATVQNAGKELSDSMGQLLDRPARHQAHTQEQAHNHIAYLSGLGKLPFDT